MILSAIFHFFKTVLGAIIKALAWLLIALSLWVPLVYTLIFVIVCGVTDASLSALSSWYFAGLAISFIGSFIISTFMYERRIAKKKKQKAVVKGNLEKVREKEEDVVDMVETVPTAQPVMASEAYVDNTLKGEEEQPHEPISALERLRQAGTNRGEPALRSNDTAARHNFYSYGDINAPNAAADGYQDSDQYSKQNYNQNGYKNDGGTDSSYNDNYGGYNAPVSNGYSSFGNGGYNNNYGGSSGEYARGERYNSGEYEDNNYQSNNGPRRDFDRMGRGEGVSFQPYNLNEAPEDFSPAAGNLGAGGYDRGMMHKPSYKEDAEEPKIFATKSDPTVLIYEYADRLEYYKRTRSGMILMRTENKVG